MKLPTRVELLALKPQLEIVISLGKPMKLLSKPVRSCRPDRGDAQLLEAHAILSRSARVVVLSILYQ